MDWAQERPTSASGAPVTTTVTTTSSLLAALRKKLASKALKAAERRHTLDRYDLIHTHMRTTLHQIIPYERPKMQAISPDDDPTNLQRVKPDLTKLTEAELDQLEKIVLKVGGAAAIGADPGADGTDRFAQGMPAAVAVRRGLKEA
jgi:hypothetical protein